MVDGLDWDSMSTAELLTNIIRIRQVVVALLGNCFPHKFIGMSGGFYLYQMSDGRLHQSTTGELPEGSK